MTKHSKILITFILLVGIIYLSNNLILIKSFFGDARNIGKPINVKVFANGKIDDKISVYKVNSYWNGEKANYYLVFFENLNPKINSRILCLNLDYKFVGLPSSTSTDQYKQIFGNLFQGEVGANFSTMENEIKGLGFNPNFNFTKKQMKLNLPKEIYKIDSLRVEL